MAETVDAGPREGAAGSGDGERGPGDVLAHWLEEVGPEGWYAVDEARDAAIRERFEGAWTRAARGGLMGWTTGAEGALAYVLLTDQLPRNMWRGQGRAFATDHLARATAKSALDRDWDLEIEEPSRQFFYLPLMHSECLPDQERCVRLMLTRMPETGADNLRHARAHREVIRRFGRFPHRNAALGRTDTAPEAGFLAAGGYGAVLRQIDGEGSAA